MRRLALAVLATAVAALTTAPAHAATPPWMQRGVLNMAHQGGEDEFPSNTMYAFRQALAAGADVLEVDVHPSVDGTLVVLHDDTVDRTTNGRGHVTDLTVAQLQRLDAAFNFVPGRDAVTGLPARRYPLRGVRTGKRRPPAGSVRTEFRIPTLREVLRAFPHVPVNIEIKARDDAAAEYLRGAELVAAELRALRRRTNVLVVSNEQTAVDRFHELMPAVPVAPGYAGGLRFLFGGESPGDGVVAFQAPITLDVAGEPFTVITPDAVRRAHEAGYAVHVWLSNDRESRRVYDRLLDMCVDGVMAARPVAFERRLAARGVVRPGAAGTDPCSVRATSARRDGGRLLVGLRRRGLGPQPYAGTVEVRSRAHGMLARGRFSLAEKTQAGVASIALTKAGRRALSGGGPARVQVRVRTRGARGDAVRSTVRVRR